MSYPGLQGYNSDHPSMLRALVGIVNNLLIGKLNVSGLVTLTANAASTTITDARIGSESAIILVPTTANAAAALATTYVSETSRVNGSVAITHANNAQVDKTFRFVVIG